MVARHAKDYDLPSYQEGDVVKLQLPEHFRKLLREPFVICQVNTGPHCGSFQLLCEFGVLDCQYFASKLKPIPSAVWSNDAFPFFSHKVSISEVADRLRQAPKLISAFAGLPVALNSAVFVATYPALLSATRGLVYPMEITLLLLLPVKIQPVNQAHYPQHDKPPQAI
jgi:hypothetical protein